MVHRGLVVLDPGPRLAGVVEEDLGPQDLGPQDLVGVALRVVPRVRLLIPLDQGQEGMEHWGSLAAGVGVLLQRRVTVVPKAS